MQNANYIITFVGPKSTYTKKDGTTGTKRTINCKRPGTTFEDEFVVTLFGSDAEQEWQVNTLINATLHTEVREGESGRYFMDTRATFILPMAMIKSNS